MSSYSFVKRLIDIMFSFTILILASPFFILVAILIKFYSPGGPIFYGHKRVGKGSRSFICWKFRTMVIDADKIIDDYLSSDAALQKEYQEFFKLKKDPRIIKIIGPLLRNSSFDEMPQFFNVLIGEMSVVGPRPIVREEIPKYGGYVNKLLSIRPGITGLWQISGRNDISYDRRVSLDMDYINNLSLRQDFIIGLKTIGVIFLHKGY